MRHCCLPEKLRKWRGTVLSDDHVFWKSQYLAIADFIFRFRYMCTWRMITDPDEFLVLPSEAKTVDAFLSSLNDTIDYVRLPMADVIPECSSIDQFRSAADLQHLNTVSGIFNTKYAFRVREETQGGVHKLFRSDEGF